MQRAFADRQEQVAFRKELEQLLRCGEPDAALARVRQALAPFAAAGNRLARLAVELDPDKLEMRDWDDLGRRIELHTPEGRPITAVSIDLEWPGHYHGKPDAEGRLEPQLLTNYYSDVDQVSFSRATRAEFQAGYTDYRPAWYGEFEEVEIWLAVSGLAALYGAVQCAASPGDSDDAAGDVYVMASCTVAIALHLAVRRAIVMRGLPQPLAVMVGSNEDFPFFDAPVMSVDESARFVAIFEQQEALRREEMDARSAKARAAREQEYAERTRFDPIAAMEHFGEAAKVGQDILKLMRKEKDVFLGIGAVGLAIVAQHLRNRK